MNELKPAERKDVMPKDKQILYQLIKAMDIQSDRITQVEDRITTVEQDVTLNVYITSRQAKIFRNAVKSRVRELLSNDELYKEFSRKYFSKFYDEFQTRFAISEYRELPRKEFPAAMKLLREWIPVSIAKESD